MSNTEKQLLVIADEQSVLLWRTVGAKGFVFSKESMPQLISYIKEQGHVHKAALLGEKAYEEGLSLVRYLSEHEIPWIVLLDTSMDEKIGYKELEKLSEKAIGMSLAVS